MAGPAGAVVQSLLLTKHLLVVSASMTDDNFLRLIYEVGAYRSRAQKVIATEGGTKVEADQFGTILSLSDDAARRQLYRPYFAREAMPGEDDSARARQLEISLDAVAMYSSDDYSVLLVERFEFLLDKSERQLGGKVRAIAEDIEQEGAGDAWSALLSQLTRFGADARKPDWPKTGRPTRTRSWEETTRPHGSSTDAGRH